MGEHDVLILARPSQTPGGIQRRPLMPSQRAQHRFPCILGCRVHIESTHHRYTSSNRLGCYRLIARHDRAKACIARQRQHHHPRIWQLNFAIGDGLQRINGIDRLRAALMQRRECGEKILIPKFLIQQVALIDEGKSSDAIEVSLLQSPSRKAWVGV